MDGSDPAQESGPEKEKLAPDETSVVSDRLSKDETEITWTASEFLAHSKSAGWYVAIIAASLVLAAIIFVLTHDFLSTGVIVLVGIIMSVYGARQPRQLQYALSRKGLRIADRFFPFEGFRSFALFDEGAFSSVVLTPLRRFGQLITIYFDPADEDKITTLLADYLPLEDRRPDAVDRLMKRIRF